EIQRIDPPPDVVAAMHNQMRAERTRRALVTEAQGDREAAVTRAEGAKLAAILEAEGSKQRRILDAQGKADAVRAVADAEPYRQETVARGQADATRAVDQARQDGRAGSDLIAIECVEARPAVGGGEAGAAFLPTE